MPSNTCEIPTQSLTVSCADCSLSSGCMPPGMSEQQLAKFDQIVQRNEPLRKGEHLFREGDSFNSIYTLRSGTIKTYSLSEDGETKVCGFHFPGEIFGVGGISTNSHANSAKTLERSAVCKIPFSALEALSRKTPALQHHFFRLMSQEIQFEQGMLALISKKTAEERVSTFLVNISARKAKVGLSETSFRLPIARFDIGNFLGMAPETVSRAFTRLQKQHVISVEGQQVEICNPQLLSAIAKGVVEDHYNRYDRCV